MEDEATRRIELVVPGTRGHLRLIRLLAGGVVSTYGLSMQTVEDARLAVDEACTWLVDVGQGAPLTVSFLLQDDSLLIRSSTEQARGGVPNQQRLALSRRILNVLVGQNELSNVDGRAVFTVAIPLPG